MRRATKIQREKGGEESAPEGRARGEDERYLFASRHYPSPLEVPTGSQNQAEKGRLGREDGHLKLRDHAKRPPLRRLLRSSWGCFFTASAAAIRGIKINDPFSSINVGHGARRFRECSQYSEAILHTNSPPRTHFHRHGNTSIQ